MLRCHANRSIPSVRVPSKASPEAMDSVYGISRNVGSVDRLLRTTSVRVRCKVALVVFLFDRSRFSGDLDRIETVGSIAHANILGSRTALRDGSRGLLVHQREVPRLVRLHTELCRVAGFLISRLRALLPDSTRFQLQQLCHDLAGILQVKSHVSVETHQ